MNKDSTARLKLEQHMPAYVHNSKSLQTLTHPHIHNSGTYPMSSTTVFLVTINTKEI